MRVSKSTQVDVGNGSPEEIINAVINCGVPSNARLLSVDSESFEIKFDGFSEPRTRRYTRLVFGWEDEE